MGSNSFGSLFSFITWGESHGPAIGVVIDGCPANIPLDQPLFEQALAQRAPGRGGAFSSGRAEADRPEILSGIFEGKSTGAPICISVRNRGHNSSWYQALQGTLRPGHADFVYKKRYGNVDVLGGGRASARETVGRVLAGVVANAIVARFGVHVVAHVQQIGDEIALIDEAYDCGAIAALRSKSPLRCADLEAEKRMVALLERVGEARDSIGGVVACRVEGLPAGVGDPTYKKLEAQLADAMLSIPAAKGFDIGDGFKVARLRGSEHTDLFAKNEHGQIGYASNRSGGVVGGISTGMPLLFRVPFKPASSLGVARPTFREDGAVASWPGQTGEQRDLCLVLRAVPVVEAMTYIVLADALLSRSVAEGWFC